MTKKQKRAEERILQAKSKKTRNFERFVFNVAKRRLKDPDDFLHSCFCCPPTLPNMWRDEFLSAGQSICGGAAIFFDQGELHKLLPHWKCRNKLHPHVLLRSYIQDIYHPSGNWKDAF